MAISHMTIALSFLAALTFVSDASLFTKSVIYTILCTIARIDWNDISVAKTAGNTQFEIGVEPHAVESLTTPQNAGTQAVEDVSMDDGDAQDIVYPTIRSLPMLDIASEEKKHGSRASSISSTTSLFDKPTHNDRPSTPDTEIGDVPEFSTLAAKYQDGPVEANTECLIEPKTATTIPDIPKPSMPSQYRPPPAPPSTSVTKYSIKPSELVHAVEDFSIPIPVKTATSNKRNFDTLQDESKIASEGHTMDVAKGVTPAQNGVPKKKKLNSRQRRQRALRQAAASASPSLLSKAE